MAVGRRRVELEVARVDHTTDWGLDRERDRVGDRMADGHRLDAKGTQLHRVPHAHLAQFGLAEDAVLLQLRLDQPQREPGSVDRDVELLQDKRKPADVIFMPVAQEDSEHVAAAVEQIGDVGKDQVDSEHVLLGEHQPRVDDEDLLVPFEGPHVDADLAEAAEREVPEPRSANRGSRELTPKALSSWGFHNSSSCSASCFCTAEGGGGGGGASKL